MVRNSLEKPKTPYNTRNITKVTVVFYLGDVIDELLVLVSGADQASLFQSAQIPEDLAFFLF